MKTNTVLTAQDKRVIRGFCEFLYEVPAGRVFTLRNVQGALRFVNRGVIPSQQKYGQHLRTAIDGGWIERVASKMDTYRRIKYKGQSRQRSAYMRSELQTLKDKMICLMSGNEWFD